MRAVTSRLKSLGGVLGWARSGRAVGPRKALGSTLASHDTWDISWQPHLNDVRQTRQPGRLGFVSSCIFGAIEACLDAARLVHIIHSESRLDSDCGNRGSRSEANANAKPAMHSKSAAGQLLM